MLIQSHIARIEAKGNLYTLSSLHPSRRLLGPVWIGVRICREGREWIREDV